MMYANLKNDLPLLKIPLWTILLFVMGMTPMDISYIQAKTEAERVQNNCFYDAETSQVRVELVLPNDSKMVKSCWPDVAHVKVPDLRIKDTARHYYADFSFKMPEGETELIYLTRCWSDRIGKTDRDTQGQQGGELQPSGFRLLLITKRSNGNFVCATNKL